MLLTKFITDGLSHLMLFLYCSWRIHTHDLHRSACFECLREHVTITFRVIFAFEAIRGTKLAGLFPCAVLLKDDRCAAVQPSTAAVDPVAVVHSSRSSTVRVALPT